MRPVAQVVSDGVVADNRAGDGLRKQRDVTGEIRERAGGWRGAAIDINDVAQCVEAVKGNANRQNYPPDAHAVRAERRKDVIQVRLEEAAVFEKTQQAEAHHNRHGHGGFSLAQIRAGLGDKAAADVVQGGDEKHQQHEPRIPPAVKNIAGEQQPGVTPR